MTRKTKKDADRVSKRLVVLLPPALMTEVQRRALPESASGFVRRLLAEALAKGR